MEGQNSALASIFSATPSDNSSQFGAPSAGFSIRNPLVNVRDFGFLKAPPSTPVKGVRQAPSFDGKCLDPLRPCVFSPAKPGPSTPSQASTCTSASTSTIESVESTPRGRHGISPFDGRLFDSARSHISPSMTRCSSPTSSTESLPASPDFSSSRLRTFNDSPDQLTSSDEMFDADLTTSSGAYITDSTWSNTDFVATEDWEPQPPTICESFSFHGGQFDVVRTVVRPNPRFRSPPVSALPSRATSSARSRSCSPAHVNTGLPSLPDSVKAGSPFAATSGALGCSDSPCRACARSPSSMPLPPPGASSHSASSITEAIRVLEGLASQRALEEEVEYRAGEYVLEQAGCGRVEIWVTEEFEEFDEERLARVMRERRRWESAPRVFFPPPAAGPR
ncbi:hypothetical protein AcV7_002014 [Taiwanofungus camphoratus]|nr:hypothetical protein AcV7_002014 [Antrodia cinnamomea]